MIRETNLRNASISKQVKYLLTENSDIKNFES